MTAVVQIYNLHQPLDKLRIHLTLDILILFYKFIVLGSTSLQDSYLLIIWKLWFEPFAGQKMCQTEN